MSKINFVVADITFKVGMITSSVVMITCVGLFGGNNFKVDISTYLVVKIKGGGGGVKNHSKKRYVIVERPHILRYHK